MAILRFDFPYNPEPTQPMKKPNDKLGARAPKLTLVGARQNVEFPEPKKNAGKARVSLWPDADILAQVKHFCHVRQITYSQFFEAAAVDFIEKTGEKTLALGARYSRQIDDLDLNPDLDETIINLSKFWIDAWNRKENKRGPIAKFKWTEKDQYAAGAFQDTDPRVLELAIVQTISQKQPGSGRIVSFRYFVPEIIKMIQATAAMNDKTLETMHTRHTQQMRRWLNLPPQERQNGR